jgi:hypothetical protein
VQREHYITYDVQERKNLRVVASFLEHTYPSRLDKREEDVLCKVELRYLGEMREEQPLVEFDRGVSFRKERDVCESILSQVAFDQSVLIQYTPVLAVQIPDYSTPVKIFHRWDGH